MKAFTVSSLVTAALASVANAAAVAAPLVTAAPNLVRRAGEVTFNRGAFTLHTATVDNGRAYTFRYFTAFTDTYTLYDGPTKIRITQDQDYTFDVVYPTNTLGIDSPNDVTTTGANGPDVTSGPVVTFNRGDYMLHTATVDNGRVYTFYYYTAYTDTYIMYDGPTRILISQDQDYTYSVVYPTDTLDTDYPNDAITTTSAADPEVTTSDSVPTLVDPLPQPVSNVTSLFGYNTTTISSFTTKTEPCDTGCEKPTDSSVIVILTGGAIITTKTKPCTTGCEKPTGGSVTLILTDGGSIITKTEPCTTGCEKPTGASQGGGSPTVSVILTGGAGVTTMNFLLFLVSMFALSF